MTPTQIMTQDAEAAGARYGMMVDGWRALYGAALDQSHFGSPKQLADVTAQAYGLARTYLAVETAFIARESDAYALEAQRATLDELGSDAATELSGPASEHLSALNDYLTHEIKVQIERDIAFLRQSLRSTYLQVQMASRANKLPLRSALMQYRIGNSAEIQFFFHDRRAQRWPSRRFIRSVWRQHLLAVYNETVLITLSEHGVDTAEIRHLDPKSQHHGAKLSIDSNTDLPTYAELKPVVFHPNADAILGRVA
jgi:hypothetical protein